MRPARPAPKGRSGRIAARGRSRAPVRRRRQAPAPAPAAAAPGRRIRNRGDAAAWLGSTPWPARWARRGGLAQQGPQGVQDVLGLRHQRGPRLQELVRALGPRVQRVAWNGKHLPALFAGHSRGDQRAGSTRRFHDQDPERQPRDDAIAARKVLPAGYEARRVLADDTAALADLSLQGGHAPEGRRRLRRPRPRPPCRCRAPPRAPPRRYRVRGLTQ